MLVSADEVLELGLVEAVEELGLVLLVLLLGLVLLYVESVVVLGLVEAVELVCDCAWVWSCELAVLEVEGDVLDVDEGVVVLP